MAQKRKTNYQRMMNIIVVNPANDYTNLENLYNDLFLNQYEAKVQAEEERKLLHEKKIKLCEEQGKKYSEFKPKEIKLKTIDQDSLRSAHTRPDRGNRPLGVSPEEFYEHIILNWYNGEELKIFAGKLCETLKCDDALPEDWKNYNEIIDSVDDYDFIEPLREFIVRLLNKDDADKKTAEIKANSTTKAAINTAAQSSDKKQNKQVLKTELSALSFSSEFFTIGAKQLVGASNEKLQSEFKAITNVFKDIVRVEFKYRDTNFEMGDNLFEGLSDWIIDYVTNSKDRDVLKVKGPLGSYKNRLMQYLYIAIERKAKDILPIYIDIASYEKAAEGNEEIGEKQFLEAFKKDIQIAAGIFSNNSDKKPLLILDGIRNFTLKNKNLYYDIAKYISKYKWQFIVCMDTDFTVNEKNKFRIHPIVSNNYACFLRIHSMNFNRKAEGIEFIKNCVKAFDIYLPEGVKAKNIYERLVRMNFLTMDAYWLTYLLKFYLNDILNPKYNISDLYEAISQNYLEGDKQVKLAAEFAYDYEYGDSDFDKDTNPYFDLRWRFIREHRSVLDFLIAKEYVRRVSELKLKADNKQFNIEQLKIFEMILQEYISRFVFTMISKDDNYEDKIILIAKKYENELSYIGQSEISFRMTGLQNAVNKKICIKKIRENNERLKQKYEAVRYTDNEDKTSIAFLLRSLNINLIYQNDRDAFIYYASLLLDDKLSNEINRGVHLEFYGDKPYIPNQSKLDFQDDTTKGFKTLNRLCSILDYRIADKDKQIYATAIEIMNLCSLLQARMIDDGEAVFDARPFAEKCIGYVDWVIRQREIKNIAKVASYFEWMKNELFEFVNYNVKHNRALVFNQLSGLGIEKSDSTFRNISENTTEHMYSCCLIGMLYLPNNSDEPEYDKNVILQMLFMHDLWEKSSIKDEVEDDDDFIIKTPEQLVMQALFMSGTYPGSVDLSQYMKIWEEWDSCEGINYPIARDIDSIQTTYQFCNYYLKHPDEFTYEQMASAISEIDEIETDIGKEITDALIVKNPLFKKILSRYFWGGEK
ncbi:MAG: HD domain-containing protein [Clostridia bacterium]|nr:HD domain-containing protein [Clostridia bacterium]